MPLPEIQYQPKDFSRGTVQKNSHVYLSKDKHYYSVPFTYTGKKVLLMYSKNVVEVYHEQRRLAFHDRVYSKYGYTTNNEHMPSSYQYMSEWNRSLILFHPANHAQKELLGCIAPVTKIIKEGIGEQSRKAMQKLMGELEKRKINGTVKLVIKKENDHE